MPEVKVVTRNFGSIDPKNIDTYISRNGLKALSRAVGDIGPERVIEKVKDSCLLGRGGAGFPTGKKWELARRAGPGEKYLICNADEGEVGTFKDRRLLEKDPFSLVEGIAIASYAIGASRAFIYLRAEYSYLSDVISDVVRQIKQKSEG